MGNLFNLPYPGDAKLEAFLTLQENQVLLCVLRRAV